MQLVILRFANLTQTGHFTVLLDECLVANQYLHNNFYWSQVIVNKIRFYLTAVQIALDASVWMV